jgi:hypothetical protein
MILENMLAHLGQSSREHYDASWRDRCAVATQRLRKRHDDYVDAPDPETLAALNAAWAHASIVYQNIPPPAPPAPLAGSPEPARLAA